MENENLNKLARAFKLHGYEIRIVGGAVRDKLLGIEPKDIDLCTNATPSEMIAITEDMGFAYIPTGLQHGTITIVVNGDQFEVTTLRIDTETDGRHAEVEFTRSFELDAARRDLTINAMSMDFDGNLYDYFGGQEDLANCRVRFVGDADKRVTEDYLRILRYFRFAARFDADFDLDEVTFITERKNLEGLKTISVERYWLEMQKLVTMPGADNTLHWMYCTSVLNAIGLGASRFSVQGLDSITALSSMLTEETLPDFLSKWKLSSDESKKLQFLVRTEPPAFEEDVEDLLMDGFDRDWVVSLTLTGGDKDLADYASQWDVPTFPITGQDLLDRGFTPGPDFGRKLNELKQIWKQAVFQQNGVSKEELLTFL